MDYSINLALQGGQDFGSTPVEWHEEAKVLEFGDAPYGFYAWVDSRFGFSEDEDSPRVKFLDEFFNSLHETIFEFGTDSDLHFTLDVQGSHITVDFFKG